MVLAPALTKEDELHWLARCLVPGLGTRKTELLIERCQSPRAIFRDSRSELESRGLAGSVALFLRGDDGQRTSDSFGTVGSSSKDRFGSSSPRRVWLTSRLLALLELAATNGKLRRAFIWGSFVTAEPAPKDFDILLIMDEDFEADRVDAAARAVFDSVRAKLLFESDVFWARSSIVGELLDLWLETYQTSRGFRKRGIVQLELP